MDLRELRNVIGICSLAVICCTTGASSDVSSVPGKTKQGFVAVNNQASPLSFNPYNFNPFLSTPFSFPSYGPLLPVPGLFPLQQANTPTTTLPRRELFVLLALILSGRIGGTTTTTTAAATTTTQAPVATPAGCTTWETWGTCSKTCRGTRTRTRVCGTAFETATGDCNTETKLFVDGAWYRADNCYEYKWIVGTMTDYSTAEAACVAAGSKLISTGLRDDLVRLDLMLKLAEVVGPAAGDAYVGITHSGGTYTWVDGYIGNPTFWAPGDPGTTVSDCNRMHVGNPFSLDDNVCTFDTDGAICERQAQ